MGFIWSTGSETMCSREIPTGTSTESSSLSVAGRPRADARLSPLALPLDAIFASLSSGVATPDDLFDLGVGSTRTNGFPEIPSSRTGGRAGMNPPTGRLDARTTPSADAVEDLDPTLPATCTAGLVPNGNPVSDTDGFDPSASTLNLANCAITPSNTRS
jgi:hypothetical protein